MINDVSLPFGIVLTGGGARGAYQAGALLALAEILRENNIDWPFQIITGTSAGAINATFLGAELSKKSFYDSAASLVDLWMGLDSGQIYQTDGISMILNGLDWVKTLSLKGKGGAKKKNPLALLNVKPLETFLTKNINFDGIEESLEKKRFSAISINAVSYNGGETVSFFQDQGSSENWERLKRRGVREKLTVPHIMASAAIPVIFPPVYVSGNYFGDGSLRDFTPLSPSIHLGARKLLVIGVKKRFNKFAPLHSPPSIGKVLSTILSGILLDALDFDYERVRRINHTLAVVSGQQHTGLNPVDVNLITPSEDIAKIASKNFESLPRTVRYFVKGLGNPDEVGDIASYILFEKPFISELIELARRDVEKNKEEIVSFISNNV